MTHSSKLTGLAVGGGIGLLALFIEASGAPQSAASERIINFEESDAQACYEGARQPESRQQTKIEDCTAALSSGELDPARQAATLVNRALLERRIGNVDAALKDCRAAIALGELNPAAAVTCSAVLLNAGVPEEARTLLLDSRPPARPQRYKYYHNLALAHHDLGDYREAYWYLEKTLRLKPGFAPALELKSQYREVGPVAK